MQAFWTDGEGETASNVQEYPRVAVVFRVLIAATADPYVGLIPLLSLWEEVKRNSL